MRGMKMEIDSNEINLSWDLFNDKFEDTSGYYNNNSNAIIIDEPTSLQKPLNIEKYFKSRNIEPSNIKALKIFQGGFDKHKTNSLSHLVCSENELCKKNFIKDFSFLFNCVNLERLELDNQTQIKEFDASRFAKLKFLSLDSCCNLKRIYSLENMLFDENGNINDIFIDLHNCENLNSEDLYKTVKLVSQNPKLTNTKIIFNANTFVNLVKNHPDLKNDLLNSNANERFFIGTEMRVYQMPIGIYFKEKKLINQVLTQAEVEDDDSTQIKIKKIYDWFLKNIKYDEKAFDPLTEKLGDKNATLLASLGYYTLLRKRGICAGISEAMSMVLNEIGIEARAILILQRDGGPHAIVRFKDGNSWYFCDPTADRYPYLEAKEKNIAIANLKDKIQNCDDNSREFYLTLIKNFEHEKLSLVNYYSLYLTANEFKGIGQKLFSYDDEIAKGSPSILAQYKELEDKKDWIDRITSKEYYSILKFCDFIKNEAKIDKTDDIALKNKKFAQYLAKHNLTIDSSYDDFMYAYIQSIAEKERYDLIDYNYFISDFLKKSDHTNFPIQKLLKLELGLESNKTKLLQYQK